MIFDHNGPNTDVQVTGGEPTLRKRSELIEIVRRIRQKGMRPTLFTSGIRAKRDLLEDLVDMLVMARDAPASPTMASSPKMRCGWMELSRDCLPE